MDDQLETNHLTHSVGGLKGHIFRRTFHVSLGILPWLYYVQGEYLSEIIGVKPRQFVSIVILLAVIGETLRLRTGLVVFGQREYESTQISAMFWGAIGVGSVFLIIDEPMYGFPLIWCLTFVDPILGELRQFKFTEKSTFSFGVFSAFIVWILCTYLFSTPLILAFIMAPICVLSEKPKLKSIDDNATMLFIPMLAVLSISVWL